MGMHTRSDRSYPWASWPGRRALSLPLALGACLVAGAGCGGSEPAPASSGEASKGEAPAPPKAVPKKKGVGKNELETPFDPRSLKK